MKTQQRNWIGRSTGTEVTFKTNTEDDITVYTTRVDTLFGVTYTVISPEHPLLKKWKSIIKNWDEVEAYQAAAASTRIRPAFASTASRSSTPRPARLCRCLFRTTF